MGAAVSPGRLSIFNLACGAFEHVGDFHLHDVQSVLLFLYVSSFSLFSGRLSLQSIMKL